MEEREKAWELLLLWERDLVTMCITGTGRVTGERHACVRWASGQDAQDRKSSDMSMRPERSGREGWAQDSNTVQKPGFLHH